MRCSIVSWSKARPDLLLIPSLTQLYGARSIDAIPKTASGKILRREMREMAKKLAPEDLRQKRDVAAKL